MFHEYSERTAADVQRVSTAAEVQRVSTGDILEYSTYRLWIIS